MVAFADVGGDGVVELFGGEEFGEVVVDGDFSGVAGEVVPEVSLGEAGEGEELGEGVRVAGAAECGEASADVAGGDVVDAGQDADGVRGVVRAGGVDAAVGEVG